MNFFSLASYRLSLACFCLGFMVYILHLGKKIRNLGKKKHFSSAFLKLCLLGHWVNTINQRIADISNKESDSAKNNPMRVGRPEFYITNIMCVINCV